MYKQYKRVHNVLSNLSVLLVKCIIIKYINQIPQVCINSINKYMIDKLINNILDKFISSISAKCIIINYIKYIGKNVSSVYQ